MSSVFKVWVHVEEIDEDRDVYEDCCEPESVGEFSTQEEAEKFRDTIVATFDQ